MLTHDFLLTNCFQACNCLYMLLLMAIYWITETFHLSVTSLIPLVLSPMLSIQTAPDIAKNYFKVGLITNLLGNDCKIIDKVVWLENHT